MLYYKGDKQPVVVAATGEYAQNGDLDEIGDQVMFDVPWGEQT